MVAAYRLADAAAARAVWESDAEVDDMHQAVFRRILDAMSAERSAIETSTHLLFITKNLERIGDHATNIAELICYQQTGAELSDRPKG